MSELKTYIGVKAIKAMHMNLGDYNKSKGWELPADEDPTTEGYRVVYDDGYVSWSPKGPFEKSHWEVGENEEFIELADTVFPSEEKTMIVLKDDYNGAHFYVAKCSTGFNNGKAEYCDKTVVIPFVHKNEEQTFPGLQSEQLAIILRDRAIKLNAKFPSEQNEKMIAGLNMFLDACKERIEDRMSRGVMGELKK